MSPHTDENNDVEWVFEAECVKSCWKILWGLWKWCNCTNLMDSHHTRLPKNLQLNFQRCNNWSFWGFEVTVFLLWTFSFSIPSKFRCNNLFQTINFYSSLTFYLCSVCCILLLFYEVMSKLFQITEFSIIEFGNFCK